MMFSRNQKRARGMSSLASAVCIAGLCVITSCGKSSAPTQSKVAEAWDASGRPEIFSRSYETSFASLPSQGATKVEPWADSYWPSYQGGIAARWNAKGTSFESTAWDYGLITRDQLKSLPQSSLARLSPAEKYDILSGNYDYPLVKFQRANTAPTNDTWWGICHGWAPAAYNYIEPKAVVVKNTDGIEIPFGASDVKALLSFQQGRSGRSVILGKRCNVDLKTTPGAADSLECRDVNAGSFHIVLANEIGLRRTPLSMDVTRDLQVWNQPIYSFSTRKLSSRPPQWGAAFGTVVEHEMITDVTYIVEMDASWGTHVGVDNARQTVTYRYFVEVNVFGKIIGGSWVSSDRPDFLWTVGPADLTGFFAPLKSLYEASVGTSPGPVVTPVPTVTAAPTAQPTVAPTPVITATATPAPTATATPAPAPTATATPTIPADPRCPVGTSFDAGIGFCSTKIANGDVVAIGPFTEAMTALCETNGGGPACREELPFRTVDGSLLFLQQWKKSFAASLRGTGECALGAVRDAGFGNHCIENDTIVDGHPVRSAFGPFKPELVARCVKFGGGPACHSLRWNASFLVTLL